MSFLIVGSEGNMGKRYGAILNYMRREHFGVDQHHSEAQVELMASQVDGILIATPTETHTAMIRKFLPYRKPILCEKPITKNIAELKELFEEIEDSRTPFRMMYQYRLLDDRSRSGRTHYDYYKHGTDGLVWDCLQVIGLARGQLRIGEKSPIWSCMLNGKSLRLGDMDPAYIGYIQTWLGRPSQDLGELLEVHQKTAEMERVMNGIH